MLKKQILLLVIIFISIFAFSAMAQEKDYYAIADECFKSEDFECAGTNFDLFLEKIESRSNNAAFRSAISWAKLKNKAKTLVALQKFVQNNYANGINKFSQTLLDESSFEFLKSESGWEEIIALVLQKEADSEKEELNQLNLAKKNQRRFENELDVKKSLSKIKISQDVYSILPKALNYQSPNAFLQNNSIALFIKKDCIDVPFFVQIPVDYDPQISTPTLIVLHGAVKTNIGYPSVNEMNAIFNATSRHLPELTKKYITIYPFGTKMLNWMNTESGFNMVNEILIYLKAYLNIDDNRVNLIGHSNGATGVFNYLIKSPTNYAGFYGMNTYPKVHLGGTFLENAKSRHFYNFTTDKDYYYPPEAVKEIETLAKSLGVDWQTQMNEGFPHRFPSMNQSLEPMKKLFEDMSKRVRNPYQKEMYFESDNPKYGTSDWLTISELDTSLQPKEWQKQRNFKITKWIDAKDFNKTVEREEMAFDYPQKSGAVKAKIKNNKIIIETSCVKSITLNLNRELIDYDKKVVIEINGNKVFWAKIKPEKKLTIANFTRVLDRKLIWENQLKFEIKD